MKVFYYLLFSKCFIIFSFLSTIATCQKCHFSGMIFEFGNDKHTDLSYYYRQTSGDPWNIHRKRSSAIFSIAENAISKGPRSQHFSPALPAAFLGRYVASEKFLNRNINLGGMSDLRFSRHYFSSSLLTLLSSFLFSFLKFTNGSQLEFYS